MPAACSVCVCVCVCVCVLRLHAPVDQNMRLKSITAQITRGWTVTGSKTDPGAGLVLSDCACVK